MSDVNATTEGVRRHCWGVVDRPLALAAARPRSGEVRDGRQLSARVVEGRPCWPGAFAYEPSMGRWRPVDASVTLSRAARRIVLAAPRLPAGRLRARLRRPGDAVLLDAATTLHARRRSAARRPWPRVWRLMFYCGATEMRERRVDDPARRRRGAVRRRLG